MRRNAGQPPQLVGAKSQHVVKAGIGAVQVEEPVQVALPAQYPRRQLVGETPVALGKSGEVAIARSHQRYTGAHGAENLEGR
jgi:hypothetical protein